MLCPKGKTTDDLYNTSLKCTRLPEQQFTKYILTPLNENNVSSSKQQRWCLLSPDI